MAAVELHQRGKPGVSRWDYPSLFAPDSEGESSSEGYSDNEEPARPSLLSLDEAIREPPRSLAALLEVLLPRLQPRAEVRGVSLQDQQNFVSILVGELASQFSVLQHQVDDPFLNQHQNKILHKQIVVQVCKIVEELYAQYLAKAAKLNQGDMFSQSASLSRLRAQLTLDANRSVNIPAVRRHVLGQLRGPLPTIRPSRLPPIPKQELRRKSAPRKSLDDLKLDEPLQAKMSKFGVKLESRTIRHRIRKLKGRIPEAISIEEESGSEPEKEEEEETGVGGVSGVAATSTRLYRVPSMPELWGNFLLCDLGLTTRTPHLPTHHHLPQRTLVEETKHHLLGIHRAQSVESFMDLKLNVPESDTGSETRQLGDYTFRDLCGDLRDLATQPHSSTSSLANGVEDLHPLLQAHVHGLSERQSRRLAEFDARVRAALAPTEGRPKSPSALSELSIPSVPTLEQLPYLTIQHASGAGSSLSARSGLSKSGASLAKSSSYAPSSMPAFGSQTMLPQDSAYELQADSSAGPMVSKPGLLQQKQLHVHMQESSQRSIPQFGSGLEISQVHMQGESAVQFGSGFVTASHDQLESLAASYSRFTGVSASGLLGAKPHQSEVAVLRQSEAQEPLQEWFEPHNGMGGEREDPDMARLQLPESSVNLSHSLARGALDDSGTSDNVLPSAVPFGSFLEKSGALEGRSGVPERPGETDQPLSPQPQPAVVATRTNEREVVRTSDVRVSERTPLNSLRLKPHGPIYNELTGELPPSEAEGLDSSLNEGREIAAVYGEIMNTLPNRHLNVENDPSLEPCLAHSVQLSPILASDTLHHRKSRRVINTQLHRPVSPPWGRGNPRTLWEKSNQYQGDRKQLQVLLDSGLQSHPLSRAYTTWLAWWKSTIDSQDFFKFASREESDYLRLVYHLYDSEGSDSEAEQEERERRERLATLHRKLEAKEVRRNKLYQQKSRYEAGKWNVNTVTMGGLGGVPEISSSDEEDLVALGDDLGKKVMSTSPEVVQQRLQYIWGRLHFPEHQQIDMAIKYSSHLPNSHLNNALELWERACDLVEKREIFLSRLEVFEREMSDPSRFFTRGHRGSSAARLEEARRRDRLLKELTKLDKQVSRVTRRLQLQFGDIVTYKGRPYEDKMGSDRTEMLYWLQQERRQAVLQPAIRTLVLDSSAVIPPHTH